MRISDWSSDVCASDLSFRLLDRFEKIWPTALVAPQLRPSPFHPAPWLKGADDASASPCSGSAWGACHAGSSAALAFFRCVAAASLGIERVTALHVAIVIVGFRNLPEIGRDHVCTPVTNAHNVCLLLL